MRKATAVVMIAASLLLYAVALSTPAAADPGGNNGDVKIHETGTAVADQRNEPHVCTFYIDGFNFDGGSSGTWHIEVWAPTGSGTVLSGTWGPADAEGNWHSATISSLGPGHYKLFFKQTNPATPGDDKHKVFWVECAALSGPTTGGTETGGTTTTTETGGTTTGNGIVIFTPNGTAEHARDHRGRRRDAGRGAAGRCPRSAGVTGRGRARASLDEHRERPGHPACGPRTRADGTRWSTAPPDRLAGLARTVQPQPCAGRALRGPSFTPGG